MWRLDPSQTREAASSLIVHTSAAELESGAARYRRRVRRARVAIVADLIAALGVSAALPSASPEARVGLLEGTGVMLASAR
ncbi:MAG: hypothetical protein NVS1B1_08860 [Candidatus Limnocylindrales bacterium]